MHGTLPARAQGSIFIADRNVIEFAEDGSVGAEWFSRLAKFLSVKKPAATLAYLLGQDENRSHHRWASGHVEARVSVLVGLLRSAQGDKVLAFIMRGVRPPEWYRRSCDAARDADIFRAAISQRDEQLKLSL